MTIIIAIAAFVLGVVFHAAAAKYFAAAKAEAETVATDVEKKL